MARAIDVSFIRSDYVLLQYSGVPGEDYVIDSDGFFSLETQPKKVGVIGAGYIAVELAGVFNGLGSDTSLFVRKEYALRTFDTMLTTHLDKCLKHSGGSVKIMILRGKIIFTCD